MVEGKGKAKEIGRTEKVFVLVLVDTLGEGGKIRLTHPSFCDAVEIVSAGIDYFLKSRLTGDPKKDVDVPLKLIDALEFGFGIPTWLAEVVVKYKILSLFGERYYKEIDNEITNRNGAILKELLKALASEEKKKKEEKEEKKEKIH